MSTQDYLEDVTSLVSLLSRADTEGLTQQWAESPQPLGPLYLDLYIPNSDLGPAVAVQQLLQLSFDAAAIHAELRVSDPREIDTRLVEAFLNDGIVTLEAIHLADGSWRINLKINFRSPAGIAQAIAITALALSLFVLLVPATPAVTVLGIGLGVAGVAFGFVTDEDVPPLKTVDPQALTAAGPVEATVSDDPRSNGSDGESVYLRDLQVRGPRVNQAEFATRLRDEIPAGELVALEAQEALDYLTLVRIVTRRPLSWDVIAQTADAAMVRVHGAPQRGT